MRGIPGLVRMGVMALLSGCGLTAQPAGVPQYGRMTDRVVVSGASAQYAVEGPLGFSYWSISRWTPPVSRSMAIAAAWTEFQQTVYATGKVHVLGTTLGEYTVANYRIQESAEAAWIVVFSSQERMYSMDILYGHRILASCAYGQECGGFHSVIAISAYTGEPVLPFLGDASP